MPGNLTGRTEITSLDVDSITALVLGPRAIAVVEVERRKEERRLEQQQIERNRQHELDLERARARQGQLNRVYSCFGRLILALCAIGAPFLIMGPLGGAAFLNKDGTSVLLQLLIGPGCFFLLLGAIAWAWFSLVELSEAVRAWFAGGRT